MRPGRWECRSRRRKYHTRFQKMIGCWLRNLWVKMTCRGRQRVKAHSRHTCAQGPEAKVLYLVSFILQQGLQLFTQHQGAEVGHRHRLGVCPLGRHAVLEKDAIVSIVSTP